MTTTVGDQSHPLLIRLAVTSSLASASATLTPHDVVVIVTADDEPVAIATGAQLTRHAPDTALRVISEGLPPLLLVPETMPISEAVASGAFAQAHPDAAGAIVTRQGLPVGVWPAERIAEAMLVSGPTRSAGDSLLQGTIDIPLIVRECRFVGAEHPCLDRRLFPEKPDEMPPCRNPRGLQPHDFAW